LSVNAEKYADKRRKSKSMEEVGYFYIKTVHFRFSGFLMIERKNAVPGLSYASSSLAAAIRPIENSVVFQK
jgi:hypothetical protein